MKSYVIVGNGAAGAAAAEKIRAGDPQGRITVFSAEPEPFYYRPRLTEFIAGQVDLAGFTLHDAAWYSQRAMDLRLGERVVEIDPAAGRVRSDKGMSLGYDALLLATGARSFIPPVPGRDKAGVLALRDAADARKIMARAQKTKTAALIGGGLLGLEAGHALVRLGLEVQVVEFFDRLLPRQMDPAGAARLQTLLEGLGFSFFLGAKAQEILGGQEVEGLKLEDGRDLQAGLILFSAGIRPNLDLAQTLGLEIDKGVKVNDRLETSRQGIWAAGDLTEHRGRLYGIWPASQEQGAAAGTNMAGGSVEYQGTVMSNSLKVVGVDLTSTGQIDAEGKYQAAVYQAEGVYRKIVVDQGKIIGLIFLGATAGLKEAQAALKSGREVSGLLEEMGRPDFDFSRLS